MDIQLLDDVKLLPKLNQQKKKYLIGGIGYVTIVTHYLYFINNMYSVYILYTHNIHSICNIYEFDVPFLTNGF